MVKPQAVDRHPKDAIGRQREGELQRVRPSGERVEGDAVGKRARRGRGLLLPG
jgi:hypothetical protein